MEYHRTHVEFHDKWHVKEQQKTHPGGRLQIVTPKKIYPGGEEGQAGDR